MFSWNEIEKLLTWYCGTCLLATGILLAFLYNPKYIIYVYYRLQFLKVGVKKKKLALSSNFSFSYIEKGLENSTSPSVLLVHGFSGSKEHYLGMIKYLPQKLHIIAVDLFGHGETSVDESEIYSISTYVNYLKKFVDLVGLSKRKFHLLGCSLGGHVVGMYSVMHPDDLTSLTMMCPHGVSYAKEKIMIEEAERTNTSIFLPKNEDDFRELMRQTHSKDFKIPSWLLSGLLQMRREREEFLRNALKALCEPHSMHQLEKNLHKINIPLLIVWGKEDKIIDIECLQTIKENLPTPPRKVVVLENVGHAIFFERPRKCAFVLLEFLNTFE